MRERTNEGLLNDLDMMRGQIKSLLKEKVGCEEANQVLEIMEELLLRSRKEWEETFNTLNEAITIHDTDWNVLHANKAAETILNRPLNAISNRKCYSLFHGAESCPAECPSCQVLKTQMPSETEMYEPHLRKFIEIKALPRFDRNRQVIGIVHIVRDITNQKRAEEDREKLQAQFIQAQKMESIGRLAGGVAHDFNNILSAIIGYSELALCSLPPEHPLKDQIKIINESGEKAAALTHQLLAFSRQQILEMKILDINSVIRQMSRMLRRMIGEDITLELGLNSTPASVLADRNQIEQVLMNLAVNARDAMPEGGKLILETSNDVIGQEFMQQHPEMTPGPYVIVSVRDTGMGMSSEVLEKIFEPFFTTKEIGKGTGLGLATVYGIIKQHNGFVYVQSGPGSGAVFTIYLPFVSGSGPARPARENRPLVGGTETIMIVDDEFIIRRVVGDILRPLGYRIIEASSGGEALALSAYYRDNIDAVLTDVIMPNMNGKQLAECLLRERPRLRVIFMSGYLDDVIAHHGVLDTNVNFIQKPVTPSALTGKLRAILDRPLSS